MKQSLWNNGSQACYRVFSHLFGSQVHLREGMMSPGFPFGKAFSKGGGT